MNSSAIIRSASPTISIPDQTASVSSDVSFGDVMDQVTDNWAERNSQIRHDAAKTAQTQIRHDEDAKRSDTANSSSRDNYSKPDSPRNETRTDHDDHYDHRDAADKHDDAYDTKDSTDVADSDPAMDDRNERDMTSPNDYSESAQSPEEEVTSGEQVAVKDDTAVETPQGDKAADPDLAAIPVINPAAQQTNPNLATQTGAVVASAPQAATQPGSGTPAQNTDGTTDGLMSSTALSQPAAGAAAKSALNGIDGSTEGVGDNDSFLSKIVDSMSGERTVKSVSETAQGTTGNNTANANSGTGNQTSANANPTTTTNQAAQQAMAGAANLQNMQPGAQPQTATTGKAASIVSATGTTDGTVQAGNGQLAGNNTLTQSNAAGQTAHTARHAPAQQVQQQVAVHIRNAASEGVDKISVQLRPEHLGRVDVKLEISHDGRVQGVIQADTRETLDMLRQDSRALQQALKDAGLNADSQSFTFEHRNEGGQSQEGNGQSRMANNPGSTPDEGDVMSGAELAEHVAIGYGINPNGLVDIRI